MALKNLFKKKVVEEPKVIEKSIETIAEKPKKTDTLKVPVDVLYEKCRKAVRNEIAKEHYEEAFEILQLTTEEVRKEFLKYHVENKGNICCLVLDKAKQDLIADGKMEYNKEAAFGHPFML